MTYRDLSALPKAETDFSDFLSQLQDALTRDSRNPNEVVSETLQQIYFGRLVSAKEVEDLPLASRALLHSLDPRNVTHTFGFGRCLIVPRWGRTPCWVIVCEGCWRR